MTMTTIGQIMSWADYLKTKENVNIKMQDLCETLIVYIFAQYISISPHGIDCKYTWCKKIYHINRASWLKLLSV